MKEWELKDYKNEVINWEEVPYLTIEEYPWYEKGEKQKTNVQVAIYQNTIHIYAKAEDKYILANAKKLNDPVHEDSCFEFFLTPWNQKSEAYFNIEINCMGILYMAYRDGKNERILITDEQAKFITIESSLNNSNAIKQDTGWELKISIPLSLLEEIAKKDIRKDIWYGNFYRCGGAKDDQYASWNSIEFPIPSFHQPLQFGRLVITD